MSLSALSSPLHHIYTPRRNRHYAPQTPSPLRTSRNANLMPPPTPANVLKATPDSKTSSSSFTTPTSASSFSSASDGGSTSRSTTTSASAVPFQFQARSRSQSPQASLAKSNAAAKVQRSSLFLDKVRQKREDSRFETRGEQALRMDFVRERKAWEERLKRRAPSFDVEVDDAIMGEVNHSLDSRAEPNNHENAMLSSTEDREIEELLSYLETSRTDLMGGQMTQASAEEASSRRLSTRDSISDEEEYDQLFMEVIAEADGMSLSGTHDREGWCGARQDQDSSMDLS